MSTYLEQLTIQLGEGISELPPSLRRSQGLYLKAAQQSDGGFAGREGGSDLYYTGFALRGLAILDELDAEVAEQAAEFLRGRLAGRESIVDFFSLIYASALLDLAAGIDVFATVRDDWRTAVAEAIERLRRPDGGYAKGEEGAVSSTYHTFLVTLCFQLLQLPLPEPDRVVEFIYSQQADEGGFREIRASKRAGTNPTAAAIGVLQTLDALNGEVEADTIDFLAEMQTDEGGLRANTRIPIADLLSTFTGTLTLINLHGQDEIDLKAARRFANSLMIEGGGFHGAVWDNADDVEYTFYGLGCLALLESKTNNRNTPI